MGKKIYITESQLDFVINNVDLLTEQSTGNKKQYSDEEIGQWITQNFSFSKTNNQAGGDQWSKIGIDFAKQSDVQKLWLHKKADPQSKTMAIEVVRNAFNESERGATLDEWRNKDKEPKGEGSRLVNLNIIPAPFMVSNTPPPTLPLVFDSAQLKEGEYKPFVDNSIDLDPNVIKAIEQMKNQILTTKGGNDNIKVKLVSAYVEASASRFRNTGAAANMSWLQLSNGRAKNAMTKIKEIIGPLSENPFESEKIVYKGSNEDGSSGPNPGKNKDGQQFAISTDGKYNNFHKKVTPEILNDHKEPHASKEDYNQYKYLKIKVVAVLTIQGVKLPDTEYLIPFTIYFKETRGGEYKTTIPDKPPTQDKVKLPPVTFKFNPDKCETFGNSGGALKTFTGFANKYPKPKR